MKKSRFRVRLNIIFEICAFGHFLQRSFQAAGERKVPDGMIDRFDQKVKDFPPPLSVWSIHAINVRSGRWKDKRNHNRAIWQLFGYFHHHRHLLGNNSQKWLQLWQKANIWIRKCVIYVQVVFASHLSSTENMFWQPYKAGHPLEPHLIGHDVKGTGQNTNISSRFTNIPKLSTFNSYRVILRFFMPSSGMRNKHHLKITLSPWGGSCKGLVFRCRLALPSVSLMTRRLSAAASC